ncbi:MAG: hypothetical protein QXT20_03585 [Candidatus Woesearchaeota archaeon]
MKMEEQAVLDRKKVLEYYSRREIQEEMLYNCPKREVAVRYGSSGFGKRPDVLLYPNDILQFAKEGATSFHVSEEIWKNPMLLTQESNRQFLDSIREGWDLVLDIDCREFEYSRMAASLVVNQLKRLGIRSVSVKFSGNKGFHIGVPFEAFPKHVPVLSATGRVEKREVRLLFPEAPRTIARYIAEMIKPKLAEMILKFENSDFSAIAKKVGKTEIIEYGFLNSEGVWKQLSPEEYKNLIRSGKELPPPRLNISSFLEIDTVLIAPRHLYRLAYSINEKSGLVSLPIGVEEIMSFKRENAQPEKVSPSRFKFLCREHAVEGEAELLFKNAFDWEFYTREKEFVKREDAGEYLVDEMQISAIPKEFFPPCIQNILKGLSDGRKRALFILENFLSSVGWDYADAEKLILEWNKSNKEPLRENYVRSQLRYKKRGRRVLPPNCSNKMYYSDIGICTPDSLCQKIRNPVNYSKIRMRSYEEEAKKIKPKRTRQTQGKKNKSPKAA